MRETSNAHKRARQLRKAMSLPEVMLWKRLREGRSEGYAFRRQHPFGPYVLDFFCSRAQLAVEVDGASHGFGDRPQRDASRDGYLKSQRIRVIRVSASDVLANAWGVGDYILNEAKGVR
jgi:very-short-patch-repair endonuclease